MSTIRYEFWINDPTGARQYFKDIRSANDAAQTQADATGNTAIRYDLNGGQSYFYPRPAIGTGRSVFPAIEGAIEMSRKISNLKERMPMPTTTLTDVALTPALMSMDVIAQTTDAVYLRLPRALQRDCGGCDCSHCKRNPELAKWDTLVVPTSLEQGEHSYTVHLPDAGIAGFKQVVRANGQLIS